MHHFLLLSFFSQFALALWPQPLAYDHGDTVLFIEKDVPFFWHEGQARNAGSIAEHLLYQKPMVMAYSSLDLGGHEAFKLRKRYTESSFDEAESSHSGEEGISGDEIIDYAIKSAWRTIFQHSLYPWKFHPRGWEEPSPHKHTASVSEIHVILLTNDSPNVAKPNADATDESYTLTLTIHGKATIAANSSIGLYRGLTTFTQLFYAHSSGTYIYTPLAPVHIHDAPAYPHRGINLDVARNWFPVADIKRQIDALAYNKMNRFHLHITDSQSWPLEIPSLPDLAQKGAYRPDLVYTPADFEDLQRHAALQGVDLITEIDMPGHTSSIWFAFPELVAAFNKQPDWDDWAAEPPSGTLKLNFSAVYEFLDKLYGDVLPRVRPWSRYFHTGGDEVNRNSYLLDDTVKSNDPAILQPLMQTFIDFNHDKVRAAGLTPIVWEEMLLEWNLTLGPDVIVQSWRSDEAVKKIVESGHQALVGNYQYWVRPTSPTTHHT